MKFLYNRIENPLSFCNLLKKPRYFLLILVIRSLSLYGSFPNNDSSIELRS